jgi:hypothetical protein
MLNFETTMSVAGLLERAIRLALFLTVQRGFLPGKLGPKAQSQGIADVKTLAHHLFH